MQKKRWLGLVVLIILAIVISEFRKLKTDDVPSLKTSRLLVNIQAIAPFSAKEFAEAASAKLLVVDTRNPFKSIHPFFVNHPFVVVSPELDAKTLASLAKRYGYRYVSFAKESLDEALYKTNKYLASIPKYSSEISYLTKENSQEIYDLMHKVDLLLTENDITYWATAGTLLGAVRHGGLIPWDGDLEICIIDADEQKLNEIRQALGKLGLEIYYYSKDFYKIFTKDGAPIPDTKKPGEMLPFKYPYVDVFVLTLEKNKEYEDGYVHQSDKFYSDFNNKRFFYSQIQHLSRIPFGPIEISAPAKPEQFLNTAYGISRYPGLWTKYAIEPTWIHQTEKSADIQGAAFVEIDDFSPAPFKPNLRPSAK